MDLEKLVGVYDDTSEMQVVHPVSLDPLKNPASGEPFLIKFYGPNHATSRKLLEVEIKAGQKRARQGRNAPVQGLDEMEEKSVDYLIGRMAGWSGYDKQFSAKEAATILKKFSWLRAQCNEFLKDDANFLPMPKPASSPTESTSSS